MKYFTREIHDRFNQAEISQEEWAATEREARDNYESYRAQLAELRPRLSKAAWEFFEHESLHDGTLLALSAGDDIDQRHVGKRGFIGNRTKPAVCLQVLEYGGGQLYTLRYEGIKRVVFDFPGEIPWYVRYEAGRQPIDEWMSDELTAVDERFLRHEAMFLSGASLLIEFQKVSIRRKRVGEGVRSRTVRGTRVKA